MTNKIDLGLEDIEESFSYEDLYDKIEEITLLQHKLSPSQLELFESILDQTLSDGKEITEKQYHALCDISDNIE